MQVISTDKAPAAIGPYSQAMKVNGMVFTSGQIPDMPAVKNAHLKVAQSLCPS